MTMIQSPVIIIGCARSGTTLLYNILSEVPELWSIGHESGQIIEHWHHPRLKDWSSGALEASDLSPTSRAGILEAFENEVAPGTYWRKVNRFRTRLRDNRVWREVRRRGQTQESGAAASSALPLRGMAIFRSLARVSGSLRRRPKAKPIRLLEKTPENCLRLPFLLELFPDARIIYLTRDGRSNINSLIEGWKHPYLFHGYTPPAALDIPGNGQPDAWAFTLIPGWQDLVGGPLEVICAQQWIQCNEAVMAYLFGDKGNIPSLPVCYEDLVESPGQTLQSIAAFIDVDFEDTLARYQVDLPHINIASTPQKDKWRRQNMEEVTSVLGMIEPTMNRLGYGESLKSLP